MSGGFTVALTSVPSFLLSRADDTRVVIVLTGDHNGDGCGGILMTCSVTLIILGLCVRQNLGNKSKRLLFFFNTPVCDFHIFSFSAFSPAHIAFTHIYCEGITQLISLVISGTLKLIPQ